MERKAFKQALLQGFAVAPIVAILGPRQCGKTTLARNYFNEHNGSQEHYFDLENPLDLARLRDPMLALEHLEGLIVIDEIQRYPNLFPILRVLVDQAAQKKQFLILGSASRELIQQSSESLAGRIHYLELTPFSFEETYELNKLWVRGGFPLAYLASSEQNSFQWRQDYIKTFLEQDIPNLGLRIPAIKLRRFWMMLAHYHGQLFNATEIANSLDVSYHTAKYYLDILSGTLMMRQLAPWHENIAKRQVKTTKVYFRDSGLYHCLLDIHDAQTLRLHPRLGASWEGFALESIIRCLKASPEECYFWATHNGAELDLLIVRGDKRLGFEFKHSKAPHLTRSMKIALEDLKLQELTVIYAGDKQFKLKDQVTCIPLQTYLEHSQRA